MIFGRREAFALESDLMIAYERSSFLAMGSFVVHIAGQSYGVQSSAATVLAATYDSTRERILKRGMHVAPFSSVADAGHFADQYAAALYGPLPESEVLFGMPVPAFKDAIYDNKLIWAPDGSEAFDDGSHGLQFDLGDQVRLIAFRMDNEYRHISATLRDITISGNEYYGVLRSWCDWLMAERETMPKTPE